MTNRIRLSLVVVACLAGSVTRLAAEDVFPLPWSPALLNQTIQVWESEHGGWLPGYPIVPTERVNPFGWPGVTFVGDWNSETIPGPHEGADPIATYHVGPGGGSLEFHIPNLNQANPVKKIQWQITADKSVTPTGSQPTTNPPGTATGGPSYQWPVDTWYTYSGTLEIQPNPALEIITFAGLVADTNISEMVIKTVCIPVPEPAIFVLLGTGAIGWIVWAWRRRTGKMQQGSGQ